MYSGYQNYLLLRKERRFNIFCEWQAVKVM